MSHHVPVQPTRRLRLRFARLSLLLVAVLVALLVAGCEVNDYPQSIFLLKSDFAIELQELFNIILIAAAFVFVVVQGALLYAAIRFRRKPGDPLPPQIHGNTKLEIAWTIAPAIVLGFVLVPTTQTIFETQEPAPPGSLQVRVIGHQFWWEFEYPELGVITANEVHMPVGTTAQFILESADVIHSFWIPALGGKRDLVPGRVNYLKWTPLETGVYPGQCAELCGASHANMRLRGIVQTPEEFAAWVERQRAPAVVPPPGTPAALGAEVFMQKGCGGCHAVRGTPAAARIGPDLTHFGSRTTFGAGMWDNLEAPLRAWLRNPPEVKPGARMPNLNLTDDEITALIAYLQALQ